MSTGKPKLHNEAATHKPLIEVPRAALPDVLAQTWDGVVAEAAQAGWVSKTSDRFDWCRPDHALVREGSDEMKGLPCLYYQRW
jgi:hypothetical protein